MASHRPQPIGMKHLRRQAPGTPLGDLRWRRGISQAEAGCEIGADSAENAQKRISEIERGLRRLDPTGAEALGRLYDMAPCKVMALANAAYDQKHPGARALGGDDGRGECDMDAKTMETTGGAGRAGLPARRPVEGRELLEAVAFVIMERAEWKAGEPVKARRGDVTAGLDALGLAAPVTHTVGAVNELLRSKRLFLSRDHSDYDERVYKTTQALADLGRRYPAGAPQAPTLASPPPAAPAGPDPGEAAPSAPAGAGDNGPAPESPAPLKGDSVAERIAPREEAPAPAALDQNMFDNFMLDFLTRASSANALERQVAEEQQAKCRVIDEADKLRRQLGGVAAERDAWRRKAEEGARLTSDDRHALRRAVGVLEQLTAAGPMQPMVEGLLATLRLTGDDLRAARDLCKRLDEGR